MFIDIVYRINLFVYNLDLLIKGFHNIGFTPPIDYIVLSCERVCMRVCMYVCMLHSIQYTHINIL